MPTIPTTTPELVLPDWVTADARVDVEIRWDAPLPFGPVTLGDGQVCDGWSSRADTADHHGDVQSAYDEGPLYALRAHLAEVIDTDADKIHLQIDGYAAIFTDWRHL